MARPSIPRPDIYHNQMEYLRDELRRLNLLLRAAVLQIQKDSNKFKGLMVSHGEALDILNSFDSCRENNEPEVQMLTNHRDNLEAQISAKVSSSLQEGDYPPFQHLTHIFHLTPLERDAILVCLAPEIDTKYEMLYAYLQDDITKKKPTIELVLNLLCNSWEEALKARTCFFSEAPLIGCNLLELSKNEEHYPMLSRSLRIDDRIVNYVFGLNQPDSRISSFSRLVQPQVSWKDFVFSEELKNRIDSIAKSYFASQKKGERKLIYHFFGPYGSGKKTAAEALCKELGMPLLIIDFKKTFCAELPFEKAALLAFREGVLQPAAIYLENFDRVLEEDPKSVFYQDILTESIEKYSWLTFLSSEKACQFQGRIKSHILINIEFHQTSYKERHDIWKKFLHGDETPSIDTDLIELSNKFRLTGGQIKDAISSAKNIAVGNNPARPKITMEDFHEACRAQSNQRLGTMAQKIRPKYCWKDIVLSPDKIKQLKEICNYAKYRHIVYGEWGFDNKLSLAKGANSLFSGPSGTGKTMTAEIIAKELNIDLYKIDLSLVVSKYIGETEKNLNQIFREAETSNAILFFDEADALFGKRSEVHDAHDRYANIEIAYLLQKMEEYNGMTILATNLSKNIDEAFLRRMQFSVEFPFPNEGDRYRIWKITFPQNAPIDKEIPFWFLARNFKITGGNIRNIILQAAFLAADNSKRINMEHIILATKREFQKIGKLCVESDFESYYELVRDA